MSDTHPAKRLPTQDELPYDDDEVMETARHRQQMELLIETLEPHLHQRQGGGYVGGDMFVYFDPDQVRTRNFKGPDVFVVLDVPARERKSWVVWEEHKGPDVVIELLSESTANDDKTHKKAVYESMLGVAEFYWYDPFNPGDFAGFKLQTGGYRPMTPDAEGNLLSHVLGLRLTRWAGSYHNTEAVWLRWLDADGNLLLTGEEQAEIARHEAESARHEAESARHEAITERERAERLAARLRALGVDPDSD